MRLGRKHLGRIFLLTLVSIGSFAQSTAGNPESPKVAGVGNQAATQTTPFDVTIKARTQVVLLDLVATDKQGRPVTDLKREDFTVLEQGKAQPFASFSLVDAAKRAPLPAVAADKLPAGVYSNLKDSIASEPQLTVVLLDALNTPWANQAYARDEMLKYLQTNQPPGQHTAIYALTSRLLRLQDFTDDPEILRRVIRKFNGAESPVLPGVHEDKREMDGMPAYVVIAVRAFEEEQAADQMDRRVRMTMDALQTIARQLAGYAGRKKLIWISGSFPVTLQPGEYSGIISQRDYSTEMSATTTLLRDSQVSVYPVDAAGLVNAPVFDASTNGRGSNGHVMSGPQLGAQMLRDSTLANAARFAAQQIADETGGLAFYNRSDLDSAIMKSVADGAVYYAVSYSPENKNWDGKFRKIEVKVNRSGVQLRYRKGYYAKNSQKAIDVTALTASQEIGVAINTVLTSSSVQFFAGAELGHPKNATPDAVKTAQVLFLVDPRDVLFQEHDDKEHCSVRFVAAVFSGDKMLKGADKSVDCDLKRDDYDKIMKEGIRFEMPVETGEGQLRIRILVRDNLSGRMGSLDVPYPPAMALADPPAAPVVKP